MRGCACSRAISVDGQYDIDYNRIIGNFVFNQTTNRTQLYSDEDVHKFYRYDLNNATSSSIAFTESARCPCTNTPTTQGSLRVRRHGLQGLRLRASLVPQGRQPQDLRGYIRAFSSAGSSVHCPPSHTSFPLTTTPHTVNEIQQLTCRADNGSFMLSFRENVTLPIDWNSTLVEFKHRLEQIFTYVHKNLVCFFAYATHESDWLLSPSRVTCHVSSGSVLLR